MTAHFETTISTVSVGLLMTQLRVGTNVHLSGLRRRSSEINLFQRVETCPKLFQNDFTGLLQLMNIFQHVHCR